MQKVINLGIVAFILLLMGMIAERVTAEPVGPDREVGKNAEAEYVPDEIIVKFKPGVSDDVIKEINQRHGTDVLYTSPFAGFKRLRIPKGKTVEEMVNIYKRNPNVEYAEPNYIAHVFFVPNDEYYFFQWNFKDSALYGTNMEPAWDIEMGNPGVIVAVIDTGVAYENYTETKNGTTKKYYQAPDLACTSFVPGYDFANNDSHPNDDHSHGTHVTGTVAQCTNNWIGVTGECPNCSIMPVKALDANGTGTYAQVADSIFFAADQKANIITLSLGGRSGSVTLKNAVAYAYGKGITIVCASGNDGSMKVSYPAAYDDDCIAVGASTCSGARANYSNGGSSLDVVAPGGEGNFCFDPNGDLYIDGILQETFDPFTKITSDFDYFFLNGTSMATPHVAGVAGLLVSNGSCTGPDSVREAIQATAKDMGAPGWDPDYGWGIVDAYAALNYCSSPPPASNNPPVAYAGPDQTAVEGAPVSFDGSGSSDDGTIVLYQWDFGDGNAATGITVTHTYSTPGMYDVTLTVTDDAGLTATDTAFVTITALFDLVMHVAGIDMALNAAGINTNALATVTLRDADNLPVKGARVDGSWKGTTTDSDSGITDSSGKVTFQSDKVKRAPNGTTFTFTVTDVVLAGWTYDSATGVTSGSITK